MPDHDRAISATPPGTLTLECVGCRAPDCAKRGCRRALELLDLLAAREPAEKPNLRRAA